MIEKSVVYGIQTVNPTTITCQSGNLFTPATLGKSAYYSRHPKW